MGEIIKRESNIMTVQEIYAELGKIYLNMEGLQIQLQQCNQRKQMLVSRLQETIAKEEKEQQEKANAKKEPSTPTNAKSKV
ncbi:MAG: hypothetical protein ABFD79_02275 [Phycisphaerales bacterium]